MDTQRAVDAERRGSSFLPRVSNYLLFNGLYSDLTYP